MLPTAEASEWSLDVFGTRLSESDADLSSYQGAVPVNFHGPIPRERLAEEFRTSSVLVLPSLEEGFGLVVPQALACGLPCIVSVAVGASDLIRQRENGSVLPVGDASALLDELRWWSRHSDVVTFDGSWEEPTSLFLKATRDLLTRSGDRGSTAGGQRGD